MENTQTAKSSLPDAILVTLVALVAWTIYVMLIATFPEPFANDYLRAIARISVVLLPAMFHIYRQHDISTLDYLHLREHWQRGLVVGLLFAGIYLTLYIITTLNNPTFQPPRNTAIWLNFIIGSPLAEELLFRGVLFNELDRQLSSFWAIVISAVMFASLHLPVWIILDQMPSQLLITSFGQLFVYGIIFAVMMKFTKSLWASLSAHWLNNLVLLTIVENILS